MDAPPIPERGDVYRVTLRGDGHELRGQHYVVVVSDAPYNQFSTLVVVPFSSHAPAASFHPVAWIHGTRTRALVEQVRVIDKSRLRERIDSLAGTTTLAEIDEQLKLMLALDY